MEKVRGIQIQIQTNHKSRNRIEANSGGGKLADLNTPCFLFDLTRGGAVKLQGDDGWGAGSFNLASCLLLIRWYFAFDLRLRALRWLEVSD